MDHPIVKIFQDQGCHSYLIACPETREAILIDPKVGRRESYAKSAVAYGVKPVAVLDTHTHADHLSDSASYVASGLPLYMSSKTGCRRTHRSVRDGDAIQVGKLTFRVLDVPGHTGDSIALEGHGLVATGDSLLVGSLGRTDFRGSDAAQLYESVRQRLLGLPDATVVLPGHNYRDVLFSTIGVERAKNPALSAKDGAEYAARTGDVPGRGNSPDVDRMLALNLEATPELPSSGSAVVACCDMGSAPGTIERARECGVTEIAPKREALTARGEWIDVRDPFEFAAGHVAGARSIPLGELGFHLTDLKALPELVVSCQGGVRSMTAARTLRYLGVARDPVSLAGGYQAWESASQPIER